MVSVNLATPHPIQDALNVKLEIGEMGYNNLVETQPKFILIVFEFLEP